VKDSGILAVGSMALDTVKTPFGCEEDALGGSVSYFSASARFFAPVSIVAVVGEDFPKKHLDLFKKLGVDTRGLHCVKGGKTFRWSGVYSYDLNNPKTLKTELNVFEGFRPKLSDAHRAKKFVFLANIDPEIQYSVLKQVRGPALTACDTMNFWIGGKRNALLKLLKSVDVFLCNDAEVRQLSGEYNIISAARWVLSRGPKLVVIKKGEHGVCCFSKDSTFTAPAYLLEKVFDPTGAGDTFAGGFIGTLARAGKLDDKSVRQAVVNGSVLASYNVESFSLRRLAGLQPADIAKRAGHFRKLTQF
jgi:sugar/nucleoside kinase (ribokinase family)